MEQTERLFDILGQIDPALIAAVDLTPKKKSAIRDEAEAFPLSLRDNCLASHIP